MTELAKTFVFIAAAVGSLLMAFVVDRGSDTFDVDELVGERLNQFEVGAAKRLKIFKFEKETASVREFEVAEDEGLWSIPSKQGYPADATKRMADAATCMIDREILRIAANSASEHATLGVVDPTSSNLDSKAKGVGLRVTMTDTNDEMLADMIIGQEVKDAEGQHYVRNANQDVVYVIEIDPEKLSTQFDDWIEDDLLKLSSFDIRRVNIKDYSIEMRPTITAEGFGTQILWDRRGEMTLSYDNTNSKWVREQLQKFDPETKELVAFEIGEEEELDEDALRELRNGLDDLVIVDVERKPAGLSGNLKAGSDFLENRAAQESLATRGFASVALAEGAEAEILSSEGELTCTLKGGVEYVLRFGDLQMDGDAAAATDAATDDESDEEQSADAGIHRYLFIMARMNEAMIEQPELDELPDLPESEDASESNEQENADESPGESASADGDDKEDDLAKIIAERERIEKENKRRLTEYQDKLKEGRERVAELNERFGDWYYVIDNNVYKQIHLGRDQVIKTKEKPEEDGDGEAESSDAESSNADSGLPGLPDLPADDTAESGPASE